MSLRGHDLGKERFEKHSKQFSKSVMNNIVPILCTTNQGIVGFDRVYIPICPIWETFDCDI